MTSPGDGGPLEDDAQAGAFGVEVFYGGWSRAGSCKCLIRWACGAVGGAEEFYAVGQELGWALGEGGGEGVGPGR